MSYIRLNYCWRLFATAVSFAVFGLGGVIIPWIAVPAIILTSSTKLERQRKARWLTHRTFYYYIHFMRVMGVLTWRTADIERLQRPGILVLANHPCLIDVVFLLAFIPNADCIVKNGLLANPAMRGYIRLSGFISNESGPELVAEAGESMANGSALIIFPEGTRTRPGEPLHFRRGAANVALRTQTPVTPVTILCQPSTLSKMHHWYQIPPRKLRMTLLVGEDIMLDAYADQAPSRAARQLTRELEHYFTKELNAHEQPL